jgi:hypothetical protein
MLFAAHQDFAYTIKNICVPQRTDMLVKAALIQKPKKIGLVFAHLQLSQVCLTDQKTHLSAFLKLKGLCVPADLSAVSSMAQISVRSVPLSVGQRAPNARAWLSGNMASANWT